MTTDLSVAPPQHGSPPSSSDDVKKNVTLPPRKKKRSSVSPVLLTSLPDARALKALLEKNVRPVSLSADSSFSFSDSPPIRRHVSHIRRVKPNTSGVPSFIARLVEQVRYFQDLFNTSNETRNGYIAKAALKSLVLFATAYHRYHREGRMVHPALLAVTCLTPFVRAACDWVFHPDSGWLEWFNYIDPSSTESSDRRFYCGLERCQVEDNVYYRRPRDKSFLPYVFQRAFGTMNREEIAALRESYARQTGKGGFLRFARESILTASVAVLRGESLLFEARNSIRDAENINFWVKVGVGFLPFAWGRYDWEYFIELGLDYSGKSI